MKRKRRRRIDLGSRKLSATFEKACSSATPFGKDRPEALFLIGALYLVGSLFLVQQHRARVRLGRPNAPTGVGVHVLG